MKKLVTLSILCSSLPAFASGGPNINIFQFFMFGGIMGIGGSLIGMLPLWIYLKYIIKIQKCLILAYQCFFQILLTTLASFILSYILNKLLSGPKITVLVSTPFLLIGAYYLSTFLFSNLNLNQNLIISLYSCILITTVMMITFW